MLVTSLVRPAPLHTLFPYTTLFRSRFLGPAAERLDRRRWEDRRHLQRDCLGEQQNRERIEPGRDRRRQTGRSEEHTSELQSPVHLVCRPLLEKKQLPCPTPRLCRRC